MPPEHLYYKELNAHDGAYYRRWASVYGESMVTLIDRILRSVKHEEQAYNSCKGILHMCNDVPRHIAAEAAQIVLMHLHASTLTSRKPLAVWLTTNRQETEQPGIFRNMKTSEGGTAINE